MSPRPPHPSAATALAEFATEDAAALRERVMDFVYPVCRIVYAFMPLAYLVFQGGDVLLHASTYPESIGPRIATGLVLILFGVCIREPMARRHLPLLWVMYVVVIQLGTSISALGSPEGLQWVLPAYVLTPVVSAPFWPTRRAFVMVAALTLLAPAAVLLLAHAPLDQVLRYAIYLFIALSIGVIIAGAMVSIHIRGFMLEQRLRAAAFFDHLTGVLSRHRFFELGQQAIGRAHREGGGLSALYIDVDHFKRLNDELGHEAGDEALVQMASVLCAELRAGDLLGRLGGEEFAVLLPVMSPENAVLAAERLRRAICGIKYRQWPLSVSIGVAALEPGQDLDSLLRYADTALRKAKLSGRNRVELVPVVLLG
ncbi:MAG TPA: GGDEF domain-containing protein [Rhodanobacteraceae bacterium]|nr:GGDEF domain-containing protein [Rhodanobacteraceae bacterium]